ncbi:hypothetical protein NQ317_002219 [Molorchus minor]|uniref:Uncharacterized protein n=1 Tax=Molorchus minor TaxID=1323400 RepID=A0ABQ9JPS3_9CUCU|nr:hypothetical protein NQ317_002219 [Molorchus minor]
MSLALSLQYFDSRKKKLHLGGSLLPEVKLHDIEQWIDRVNTENRFKPDFTIYSELSTIYGDEVGMSFKPEGTGCAVNSTFVESDCVYFDALFGNDKRYMKLGNVPVMVTNKDNARNKEKSSSDIVIDESFTLMNLSPNQKVYFDGLFENDKRYLNIDNVPGMVTNGDNGRNKEKSSRDIVIDESFADLNENSDKLDFKSKENIEVQESGDTGNIFYTPKKPITENFNSKDNNFQTDIVNNDLASMLDNLYGNSWREKEEHVLPKTEPRRLLPKPNIYHPKTERKGWLLLLFAMASWERLKFILETHLLYSPEKTQKTRNITNSRTGETKNLYPGIYDSGIENPSREDLYKPKFSLLYKNPYLGTETTKSNNLLENLHKARLQMHLESPWSQQLNHLCDSDTQSEDSFKRSSPRKKLDFDSNDDEVDICNDENKISKYFKHKSELANSENNLDKYTSDDESSFLGDTLEERIRKKNE